MSGGRLLVLADGPDGVRALWSTTDGKTWAEMEAAPNSTALGRAGDGVAIATGTTLEIRGSLDTSASGTSIALSWPAGASPAPIASVDVSASGTMALATAQDGAIEFATGTAGGAVAILVPTPAQAFSPLISWLAEDRVLVLSTDAWQVSHLAVVDMAARVLTPVTSPAGARVFAVSGDRATVAAATETGIYVFPAGALGSSGSREASLSTPTRIATLGDGQVVWAMALDRGGSRLYMLSGTVGPDGSISSIRELGYARQGPGWASSLDAPVPFVRAIAQLYLP